MHHQIDIEFVKKSIIEAAGEPVGDIVAGNPVIVEKLRREYL